MDRLNKNIKIRFSSSEIKRIGDYYLCSKKDTNYLIVYPFLFHLSPIGFKPTDFSGSLINDKRFKEMKVYDLLKPLLSTFKKEFIYKGMMNGLSICYLIVISEEELLELLIDF